MGYVPYWANEPKLGDRPPPINARSETAISGMFEEAYRSRRCLIAISGLFEWKAIKG